MRDDTPTWKRVRKAGNWLCPACKKLRNCNYCPDCGAVKVIEEQTVRFCVADLLAFAREFRITQARQFNKARTYQLKADALPDESAEQTRIIESCGGVTKQECLHTAKSCYGAAKVAEEKADLLEWAIEQISEIAE